MKVSTGIRIGAMLAALVLAGCASQGTQKTLGEQNSGFLKDYSNLQWTQDRQGNPVRTWISPSLAPERYDAILLEPLRLYPEPRPTEQVSREELERILAYANQALKRELAKRFVLVNRPQPGAVRLRAAISGVAAQGEGLAPYQYVPIALAATMAKRAVAGTPQRAFIVGESELLDSVSGELLAQQVKVGSGAAAKLQKIAGKDRITLETVKPLVDELAAAALPNLEQLVRPRGG
ncbi:DUF3313 domain-containing protein [Imhoffiella purpurea]|uniref:Putative lipoprotein n=1 Tax=Imhoffiella purpurea TaxID=1249627 RepID=W9V6V8_9GAMM|nr:DUF3313 domain-containing protein [Imhoffiella purpurea]EXJ12641.1 putative lipoprotein [Imhoffiella purpurea]